MEYWALSLYPMMGIILYSMWRKVRGRSVEDILDASAHEHHALADVFSSHPEGGTAEQYAEWLEEADQRRG